MDNRDTRPTEYGGHPINPRLMPDGRMRPQTVKELAQEMRSEGIRNGSQEDDR